MFSCKFQYTNSIQSNPNIIFFTMFPKLFFFISLLFCSLIFAHSYDNTQCLNHQKNLLLHLKNELIFDSSISTKLVQWNHTDNCCRWHGVECDGAGHVVSLQLDDEDISGGIGDSSSLFGLEYLEKLNLAYNDFNSSVIPKGIHNLKYLTHLNLSNAGFHGQVPLQISSLGRLVSLDISFDYRSLEPPKLKIPNLEMLVQNLTGLRELYLDGVNITSSRERSHWSHIISSHLPNLTALSLCWCHLSGPLSRSFAKLPSLSVLRLDGNNLSTANPDLFANFSSLTTLSLLDCSLKGSFPHKIFQIPTLQHLDLSSNEQLSGSLPQFPHSGSLKSLRLTYTDFSGSIPSSIGNLKTLSEIDLSYCGLGGPIPSTFANLTQLTHVELRYNLFTGSLSPTMFDGFSNLVYLNMAMNSFTGKIPNSLFHLPSLQTLYLSRNNFTGVIEEFPTINVSKIVNLFLSGNRLEGPIPDSLFQLQSLEILLLNHNLFDGSFQLEKIQNFANLTTLDLSDNNLSVHVSNDNWSSSGLPKLDELSLGSCNLHDFPHFIKQYSNQMGTLDLSNNRISGEIPNWIWGTQPFILDLSFNLLTHVQKPYNIPPLLRFLDLQSNQLKEELHLLFPPNISYALEYLSLRNNSLSGSIPTSLCTATNLLALDLSMNELNGTIPSCLLDGTIDLTVLDLGQNNFSGHIPDSLHLDCALQYLNLSNNTLRGKIPKSIESCEELELMNVGNNLINDTFPCMLSSSLRVLVLRSNRFHGEVKCHNTSWPELQIVDISSNNFGGSLKSANFSSWRRMVQGADPQIERTALSYDYQEILKAGVRITMKGLEVEIVKIFTDFTTIDFSCNNFHGEIPKAIGDLSSLRLLNFSHNALDGSIPKSFGKLGELESLDLSRNQLTGHIPTELSRLKFLSLLNVSYNRLNGEIPKGSQLQTFPADSFIGNPGLCGFNLNISCTSPTTDDDDDDEKEEDKKKGEIEWEYVSSALGYVVGLGGFAWVLIFCRSFRYRYFGKIEEVVEEMFDAIDRRRRRRRSDARRRRAVRNREVRRH